MTTTPEFLDFWSKAIPNLHVHPDDAVALKNNRHQFPLDKLVGPWMGPMAECDLPSRCEGYGFDTPRAFLNVPYFACMPAEQRKAQAVNERSRHAPKTLDQYKASHGPGCGCCSPKPSRRVARTKSGAKSFPASRPWMISH